MKKVSGDFVVGVVTTLLLFAVLVSLVFDLWKEFGK